MEIILLEPIKNLGKTGDKVEVKNGFARNYLIPRGVALRANKANLEVFESRKSEIEKVNGEKKAIAETLAKKLKNLEVTVIRQAAEDGRLYGSVTVREIAEHIQEKGFEVDSKSVELANIIKAVGIYNANVVLHAEVSVPVKVNVARSESEAESQTKTDKAEAAAAAKAAADEAAAATAQSA